MRNILEHPVCSPPTFFPLNFYFLIFFQKNSFIFFPFSLIQILNPPLSEKRISDFAHLNFHLPYCSPLNFKFQIQKPIDFILWVIIPPPSFLIFHHSISDFKPIPVLQIWSKYFSSPHNLSSHNHILFYSKIINRIILHSNENCQ